MDIKEAKEQIKYAMTAYFSKDEYGSYIIPPEKQRPVFLMGPPGIGKTDVMEQIASEMGVGLLSYSMTHHTRQSALGLPFIVHKKFGDEEFDVSEYTMSEIISSVYELMEKTGIKEGILFLDEINCVSETLSPIMLQFLQYKIFGRHRVPDGWIVVTAGNPPEYNSSVREFDIVTWDRLKCIEVEPDFDAWKEYAYKAGVHASVLTYLEIRRGDFYRIETTADGKSFVTARGWDDLSQMMILCEKNDIPVDEKLISQYIRSKSIAVSFAAYYDLFNKYKSDYRIGAILDGASPDEILYRARAAEFDERLSVLGLILEVLTDNCRKTAEGEIFLRNLLEDLKFFKKEISLSDRSPADILSSLAEEHERRINKGKLSGNISPEEQKLETHLSGKLAELKKCTFAESRESAFANVKTEYDLMVKEQKQLTGDTGKKLSNAFRFIDSAFSDGQEMLIFVTELTADIYTSKFISRFGCKEYYEHNKELLFYERQKELLEEITELEDL